MLPPRRRIPCSSRDPYADLDLDGYALAATADPNSLAPEIALLRALIKENARQLQAPGLSVDQFVRLQRAACRLIDTLSRAVRLHATLNQPVSPHAGALDRLIDSLLANPDQAA